MVCGARAVNSSNRIGRLSNAEGKRKPYSTNVSLRERSPRYSHKLWNVTCDSSIISNASVGNNQMRWRGFTGARPDKYSNNFSMRQ